MPLGKSRGFATPEPQDDHLAPVRPRYHCDEQPHNLRLIVHVPGADPSGIDLEVNAPDVIVTAPRGQSAHPFAGQKSSLHDYKLCLRLGNHLQYDALRAELHHGVLTITIPKKSAVVAA
jgi:HSP20 family molecular chaperone IbpA